MTKRVLMALYYAWLTSCAPTFDVQLRNDTGHRLVIATPLGKPPDVGITPGAAAPVDILVAPDGIMERFSVMTPNDSWTYFDYLRAFVAVPSSLREQHDFGGTRIHTRIDPTGRIYLLSKSNQPVAQTLGFPIIPQVHRHGKVVGLTD
jgi:hypothetical protein